MQPVSIHQAQDPQLPVATLRRVLADWADGRASDDLAIAAMANPNVPWDAVQDALDRTAPTSRRDKCDMVRAIVGNPSYMMHRWANGPLVLDTQALEGVTRDKLGGLSQAAAADVALLWIAAADREHRPGPKGAALAAAVPFVGDAQSEAADDAMARVVNDYREFSQAENGVIAYIADVGSPGLKDAVARHLEQVLAAEVEEDGVENQSVLYGKKLLAQLRDGVTLRTVWYDPAMNKHHDPDNVRAAVREAIKTVRGLGSNPSYWTQFGAMDALATRYGFSGPGEFVVVAHEQFKRAGMRDWFESTGVPDACLTYSKPAR